MLTKNDLNDLTYEVVGAAIEVHKEIEPGLLESVYHKCLKEELRSRCIMYQSELIVPIAYKNIEFEADLRCDLFVEGCLVVELKAVQEMHPVFESQLLTYMKLLEAPKGILMNFFCNNFFKEGQKTFVNELFRDLSEY
ncbi:MAG: GxxExxY protein [Brumimicrobium sp.]|nr:GxxExxY protein [Brumimicrobium sp.]